MTALQMAQLAAIATEDLKLCDLTSKQGIAIKIDNAHYAHIRSTVSDRLDDVLLQVVHLRSDMATQIYQSYESTKSRVDVAINGINI
jgi:hypothetical protein